MRLFAALTLGLQGGNHDAESKINPCFAQHSRTRVRTPDDVTEGVAVVWDAWLVTGVIVVAAKTDQMVTTEEYQYQPMSSLAGSG